MPIFVSFRDALPRARHHEAERCLADDPSGKGAAGHAFAVGLTMAQYIIGCLSSKSVTFYGFKGTAYMSWRLMLLMLTRQLKDATAVYLKTQRVKSLGCRPAGVPAELFSRWLDGHASVSPYSFPVAANRKRN